MSYVKPAAKLLVEILRERVERQEPTRTVDRGVLLEQWHERFPDQAQRQTLVTDDRKVKRSRTTYLAGVHHRGGQSSGRVGTARLNEALRQLARQGVLTRDEKSVVVLDVPKLVELARPGGHERSDPPPQAASGRD